MSFVGIIANPASGKDIRRLVSHATVVSNNEKVSIVSFKGHHSRFKIGAVVSGCIIGLALKTIDQFRQKVAQLGLIQVALVISEMFAQKRFLYGLYQRIYAQVFTVNRNVGKTTVRRRQSRLLKHPQG